MYTKVNKACNKNPTLSLLCSKCQSQHFRLYQRCKAVAACSETKQSRGVPSEHCRTLGCCCFSGGRSMRGSWGDVGHLGRCGAMWGTWGDVGRCGLVQRYVGNVKEYCLLSVLCSDLVLTTKAKAAPPGRAAGRCEGEGSGKPASV